MVDASASRMAEAGKVVRHELTAWAWISAYLFVCFAAIWVYQLSLTGEAAAVGERLSFAAVRAIIVGKFVLMGRVLGVGELAVSRPLAVRVLRRSIALLLITVLLVMAEEVVVGLIHGHTALAGISEFLARGAPSILATSFLMFVLLIPVVTAIEVSRTMEPGSLNRVLFGGSDRVREPRPHR